MTQTMDVLVVKSDTQGSDGRVPAPKEHIPLFHLGARADIVDGRVFIRVKPESQREVGLISFFWWASKANKLEQLVYQAIEPSIRSKHP